MRTLQSVVELNDFYRCKEWVALMETIRLERNNICEFCGNPIVNSYDSVGHHKIELNNRNFNDSSISLNPENIMLVHHRCHNRIHNKLGKQVKSVYIVYGSPCSGKTTYVRDNAEYGDLIVDMDSIWQCITGRERYVKPNRLKDNAFAVRNLLIENIKYRVGGWQNAYLIGGYPLSGERERLATQLGAKLIYIDTPKDVCISRLEANPQGRDTAVWRGFIDDWWDRAGR